jgi:biopolymer transport protein ExbB
MQLLELYREGGFIMHPLLGCLVLSLAVAIEKLITLAKFKKDSNKINSAFKQKEDLSVFNKFIAQPYLAIKTYQQLGKDEVKSNSERYAQQLNKKLSGSTWMIGTVASSAPFIGLLGTVVGIIKSFASISKAGKGGFAIVAADLSEALVATAAGILVAIVALILFNYIKQKIKQTMDQYSFELENNIEELFLNTKAE